MGQPGSLHGAVCCSPASHSARQAAVSATKKNIFISNKSEYSDRIKEYIYDWLSTEKATSIGP